MIRKLIFTICSALLIHSFAWATIEQVEFDSPQTEQRYRDLIAELRCLVCQNQNLADSDAPLAKDLRTITANMLSEGATDQEIKNFMRERYGDFVLYKPPFNSSTLFLWLGPFVLLLLVLSWLFIHIRRRQHDDLLKSAHVGNEAERVKVRNLLRNSNSIDSNPEQKQ